MSKKVFKDANYPTFEITFEEDGNSGVRLVSLVKDPAIEEYGMYFSKEEIINYQHPTFVQQPMIEQVVQYFLGKADNPCPAADAIECMRIMESFVYGG